MKNLTLKTMTRIQIDKNTSNNTQNATDVHIISITGDASGVMEAKKEIESIIHEKVLLLLFFLNF